MSINEGIDIAVVGLGFGESFLPIYQDHPDVGAVAIVDTSPERLEAVGDRYGISDRYLGLDDVLADERWDAVHILAPVAYHAEYSLAVLRAGKHCACAVPMATEVDDLYEIVAAQRQAGTNYMMMETTVYGREYLLAEEMYRKGELGELTLYRGYHVQNLDGYPEYWRGFPPMKYVTHALSPLLALTGSAVREVTAYGSGRLTADREGPYVNPYPAEVGLFRLWDTDVVADITMSFFQTARSYTEGFSVYGDRMSLEWSGRDGDAVHRYELLPLDQGRAAGRTRGRRADRVDVQPPDHVDLLPQPLTRYVRDYTVTPAHGGPELRKGAAHGGSHPHLVHEFVSSIVEGRPPAIDAVRAAEWTAPGICAHESALRGGVPVEVPRFAP